MLQNKNNRETVEVSVASERAEAIGGVLIALFAALMAISQISEWRARGRNDDCS